MDNLAGRGRWLVAGVAGVGSAVMAAIGALAGVSLFGGLATVLVSSWFAASLPISLLLGGHLAAEGFALAGMPLDDREGIESTGGEVSPEEDWGMRSASFPVYTSQSPEAGLLPRMRSSGRPER